MANTAQLDATIDALDGGLKSAKNGASSNLQTWIETLNSSNDPQLKTLGNELSNLQATLAVSDIDSNQLRQQLDSIGQHTQSAASKAEGKTAEKIRQLGKQLIDAANSI